VDRDELSRIEEVCFPLARLWLESSYEDSPLQVLKQFSVDEGVRQAFIADFSAFLKSEAQRQQVLSVTSPSFEIDEPGPYREWLDHGEAIFGSATESTRRGLTEWFDFFASEQVQPPRNGRTLERLDKTRAELAAAEDQANEPELLERAHSLNDDELTRWLLLAERAADVKTIWHRLNLLRWMQKRQVQSFLREMGDGTSDDRLKAFRGALRLETRLQPLRSTINQIRKSLRLQSSQQISAGSLRRELDSVIAVLRPVEVAVAASIACPRPVDAEKMARSGSADAFANLRRDFEDAIARQGARHASRQALSRLSQWIETTWIAACGKAVSRGASSAELLQGIVSAVETLEPYQRFRARAQEIDPVALAVFALLRDHADALRQIPSGRLEKHVRDTIHREALSTTRHRKCLSSMLSQPCSGPAVS
jgi:primosomal replication protein N''